MSGTGGWSTTPDRLRLRDRSASSAWTEHEKDRAAIRSSADTDGGMDEHAVRRRARNRRSPDRPRGSLRQRCRATHRRGVRAGRPELHQPKGGHGMIITITATGHARPAAHVEQHRRERAAQQAQVAETSDDGRQRWPPRSRPTPVGGRLAMRRVGTRCRRASQQLRIERDAGPRFSAVGPAVHHQRVPILPIDPPRRARKAARYHFQRLKPPLLLGGSQWFQRGSVGS